MKLVVITTPELASAFALAGSETRTGTSPDEADAALRELAKDSDVGVVAVHEPFLDELGQRRDELEQRGTLVVGLPSGEHPEKAGDRRARLLRMVRRAVGYEITFPNEEGDET